MYDVIYKPINKKKFPALYVIIQNKQKTNNMNYNNKTILLALATTTASAVKLRSQNIFGDIADYTNEAILKPVGNAFEDAGEWVEGAAEDAGEWVVGAAEDVGDATEDAFNTITDFGNDLVLAVDEDVTVALDEMNTAFTDIGNFANDIFLDSNLMPDLAYDIETGIIDPTDEMLEDMWNGVYDGLEDAGDAMVDAGNWIADGAEAGAEAVGDAFVGAGDAIIGTEAAALEAVGIDTAVLSAEEIALLTAAVIL